MKLLYISTYAFDKRDGIFYGLPANAEPFFQKYLDVFEEIRVLGRRGAGFLNVDNFVPITDKRIKVRMLPSNRTPREFVNDGIVKKILREEISQAEAILIKPSTRKGMMAEKIADELHKPYMIEMTGDVHNALSRHPDWKRRLYAPFLYHQIKYAMRNCKFGLYVSQDYLQNKYPINGETCGCSDVVIEPVSQEIIERRIQKIRTLHEKDRVNMALIGFYQGKMKGVDTAIRALSQLPDFFHLNILGNGTQENRDKWIKYGEKYAVFNRIHFPAPLPSSHEVLEWLDTQDFFVLPTLSEGLCRCVVEAISRGCPCFCTDITTMSELLPKDCLFQPKDDSKLASLVLSTYENLANMESIAYKNFDHAKDYDAQLLRNRRNDFLRKFKKYCEEI